MRKILLSIIFLFVLSSEGGILDLFQSEKLIISKKIGNYTTVEKEFLSDYFVIHFENLNFQYKIGFFASLGLQPLNDQNFAMHGPVNIQKNANLCSRSYFLSFFKNKTLELENPNFCEENYCNNYTFSSFSTSQQIRLFFVTEFLLTNSNVILAPMDTINLPLLKKSEMEVVYTLMSFINHGRSVENSWNLMNWFQFKVIQLQFVILIVKIDYFFKIISSIAI
jgi:hypothetical protein